MKEQQHRTSHHSSGIGSRHSYDPQLELLHKILDE
jgi:hypothetical protein